MDNIKSTGICENWKGNKARRYGDNIATYASRVIAEIVRDDSSTEPVQTYGNFIVIEGYESGQLLPDIQLQIVDDIGQGLAIGVMRTVVRARLSSPDNFLSGVVTIRPIKGRETFTGIFGIGSNKTYDLIINFSEMTLAPLRILVKVRACHIGESLSPDGLRCFLCNSASYNFRANRSKACLPCPENTDCSSSVNIPEKGYWHSFPCSEHIQRCLTNKACSHEYRQRALTDLVVDVKTCDFNIVKIANYRSLLCAQVYFSIIIDHSKWTCLSRGTLDHSVDHAHKITENLNLLIVENVFKQSFITLLLYFLV